MSRGRFRTILMGLSLGLVAGGCLLGLDPFCLDDEDCSHEDEFCHEGVCVECLDASDCLDADPCTTDSCESTECKHETVSCTVPQDCPAECNATCHNGVCGR